MKKISILLSLALSLSVISCDKWLDINNDPNSVSEAEAGLMLPAVELNLISVSGFYGHMLGSYYAQQYAIKPGGPQYLGLSHWDTKDGTLGANWSNRLYTSAYQKVAANAKFIRETAAASKSWGDYLAATVLMVYNYQILVDAFGETPYSEALNTSILSPKYDDGRDVYKAIIAELDDALSKVSPLTDQACDNMLFSSDRDINNWIQFGNALKLKLLMRESGVVNVKTELDLLVAENNFPQKDIKLGSEAWTNQAGKDNPVFSELVRERGDLKTGRTIEVCANMAVTATMQEVGDPRLAAKFVPSVGFDNFEGGFIDEQMSKEISDKKLSADTYAELNLKYNTPIYILTVAETDFFLAEYYSREELGNDDAKAKLFYEKAIDSSFGTHGLFATADEKADTIYGAGKKYAWDTAKAIELIGIQKWIALANINGFESWCEMRRLGYPAFNSKTGKEIYEKWDELAVANVTAKKNNPTPLAQELIAAGYYTPGTVYTPVNKVGLPDNTYLGRLPYVVDSRVSNSKVPEQKNPKDKVFWAETIN